MSTKTIKLSPTSGAGNVRYKLVAAVLWGAACYTTWLFLDALQPGIDWWWALVIQGVLTVIESDFFRGQRNMVSTTATGIDTAINAGGLWPLAVNLGKTQTWVMVQNVTNTTGGVSPIAAGALAVLVGLVLAAAPERIWR